MGEIVIIYSNGQVYEIEKEKIEIYNPFPEKETDENPNLSLILEE